MENFCLRNPLFKSVRWVRHGQDHGRDLSIKSHGELGHCCKFVFKLGFSSEVFKVIDILL